MIEADRQPQSQAEVSEKVVVLLVPEALGGRADAKSLRKTFGAPPVPIRILVCLAESPDPPLVTMLADLGIDTEILVGAQVEEPTTSSFVLRALPGTSPQDLIEFAIALSDVVLVGSQLEQGQLVRHVTELKKRIVILGDPLLPVPQLASPSHYLDPDVPGWHARGRRWFGRLEQAILEILAYAWLGWTEAGLAESNKRLRRCFGSMWRPKAYFAPDGWQALSPDRTAIEASSKVAVRFDALDRSALYGSYAHRDLTWFTHLLAAFAVS